MILGGRGGGKGEGERGRHGVRWFVEEEGDGRSRVSCQTHMEGQRGEENRVSVSRSGWGSARQ